MFGKLDRYVQKNETRPSSYTTHNRIYSKWTKDLNDKPKTIKNVEENIGSKILDTAYTNILLDILQVREMKGKINELDYIKLKIFCTAKEIINKMKRQLTEWENIFAETSDKGWISNTYKELIIKLNT